MKLKWNDPILQITQCPQTSMDALFEYFHISKKNRYNYYQNGKIKINHKLCKRNQELTIQDLVEINTSFPPVLESCVPCFDELSILFEDELFLIVNKASGLLVHSDGTQRETTLYDLVKGYYTLQGIQSPVRAIHRLDYETSGIVVFCKIVFFQPLLDFMLKEKQIKRTYIAFCEGTFQKKSFTIDASIAKDRHANKMRISKQGKCAKTTIELIKSYASYSCVKCELQQGRTHQIRVHLSSLQHPILHDVLYGNKDSRIPRCALHAYQVEFFHPLYQIHQKIECPLPKDMEKLF